jgi:zona occludens toxin
MAINAYVGLQGSGKSYEVVSSVILDAVMHGRRVVTNIAGISEERIHEYLVTSREADPEKLGTIVHVENDRIMQPAFFPDEEKPGIDVIVQGGDLVAVDEAWRFWGTDGGKLSHEHMQFFRMHRHYVHRDTAVACDVVLMTQDISGLHRSVKNVIEFTFKMHKHKSLGLTKCYRVEIYEGWKLNNKTRIDDRQKKYTPEIFPLYQSYTGGQGMEKAIDKRQNILANRTLWFYAVGVVAMMTIGGLSAWRFFHRKEVPVSSAASTSKTPAAAPTTAKAETLVAKTPEKAPFSDAWRVVGQYSNGKERWIVVSNQTGRLRVESPSMFHGSGMAMIGEIDGERVTRWSGAEERAGMSPIARGIK